MSVKQYVCEGTLSAPRSGDDGLVNALRRFKEVTPPKLIGEIPTPLELKRRLPLYCRHSSAFQIDGGTSVVVAKTSGFPR